MGDNVIRIKITAEGLELVDQTGKALVRLQGQVEGTAQSGASIGGGIRRSLSEALPSITGTTTGMLALGAATAAGAGAVTALGVAASATFSAIGRAQEIQTLVDRTGLAAETLSVLKYQAELAGASMNDVGTGVNYFSRQLAVARALGGEAAAEFRRLGIDVEGPLDQALRQAADAIDSIGDAETRAQITQELFGRGAAELIPIFKGGSTAAKAAREELEALGGVYSGSLTKASQEFGDKQTRLNTLIEGMGNNLANQALPYLNEFIDALLRAGKAYEEWASKRRPPTTPPEFDSSFATFQAEQNRRRLAEEARSNPGGISLLGGEPGLSVFSDQQNFSSPEQQAAFARDKSLAEQARIAAEEEKKRHQEAERAARERARLEKERQQEEAAAYRDELASTRALGEAALIRAQAELDVARLRRDAIGEERISAEDRLRLASEIDAAEQRVLETRIQALEAERQAILAVAEPTKEQLAQAEKLTAEVQRMKDVWAATPSEIQKTTRAIEKGSTINLGGSIRDVITGTGLGTGDLGDSLKRLGQSVASELFGGMLEEKGGFDLTISKNFLEDIPGWIESGASLAQDAWSGVLDFLGLASEQTADRIGGSFADAFSGITGDAGDTAQVVGGLLRNIPGLGDLLGGGAEQDLGGIALLQQSGGLAGGILSLVDSVGQLTGLFETGGAGPGGGASPGQGVNSKGQTTFFGIEPISASATIGFTTALNVIDTLSKKRTVGPYGVFGFTDDVPLKPGQALGDFFGGAGATSIILPIAAMLAAIVIPIVSAIQNAVYQPPTGEGLIGDALGNVFKKAGIPIPVGAGGRYGSSEQYTGSPDLYFPQVPLPASYAGIDRESFGAFGAVYFADAARVTDRISTDDVTKGPVQTVLNVAASLGLAMEDAADLVRQTTTTMAGDFDAGLLELSKFTRDAQIGRNPAASFGSPEQALDFLVLGVEQLIDSFYDLPPAIDDARLAALALGETGELQVAALKRQIQTALDLSEGLNLQGAIRAGLTLTSGGQRGGPNVLAAKEDFRQALTQNARGSVADIITGQLAEGAIGESFQTFTAQIAEAGEAFRSGDFARGNELVRDASREFDIASQSAADYFQTIREQAPDAARLIDRIEFESLGAGLKDSAKSLREEADDLGLSLLKPKAREGEIRNRLGANQAEIDAILNSAGGADTAEELTRLGELGTERRELLGTLGGILDERYIDGSKREVAALGEVQQGLVSLANVLDAAGLSAEAQGKTLTDQVTATDLNTSATAENTAALQAVAEALGAVADGAGSVNRETVQQALIPLLLTVLDDPRVKAKIKGTGAQG